MKTRISFVSNSSSSSFVVEYLVNLKENADDILKKIDSKYQMYYTYQVADSANNEMQTKINQSIENRIIDIINHKKKKYAENIASFNGLFEYIKDKSDIDASASAMLEKKKKMEEYIKCDVDDIKKEMLTLLGNRFYFIIDKYCIDENQYIGSEIKISDALEPYEGYACEWCTDSNQNYPDEEYTPYISPTDTAKVQLNELINNLKELESVIYEMQLTIDCNVDEKDASRTSKKIAECTAELKHISDVINSNLD